MVIRQGWRKCSLASVGYRGALIFNVLRICTLKYFIIQMGGVTNTGREDKFKKKDSNYPLEKSRE